MISYYPTATSGQQSIDRQQYVVDFQNLISIINTTLAALSTPPSGVAGGDLNGTYPNPGVHKVNGGAVPTSGKPLASNGSGQLVDVATPAWTALPALQNSWADVGSTFGSAAFLVDGHNVFTRGAISGGTATDGTLLWTYAAGQRPTAYLDIPVVGFKVDGVTFVSGCLQIHTDGTVYCFGLSTAFYIILGGCPPFTLL